MPTATATAHPNLALCKYWGKRDRTLNLPSTPSLSLTLAPFVARTTVTWGATADTFLLDGTTASADAATKVYQTLDRLRPDRPPCIVESHNNFPTAAGLASSAAGFAALVVAANEAGNLGLSTRALAVHARRGSGSATRSLHGGWVAWPLGVQSDGLDSVGVPLAPTDHWDVRMLVAVLGAGPKAVGSTEGMLRTQATSPYYPAWVDQAPGEYEDARGAVADRDMERLGAIMERSALRMHASMLAAVPPFCYWRPESVAAMEAVRGLRRGGTSAWFTMDAGPNVKVLCAAADAPKVYRALSAVSERVEVLHPGGPAVVTCRVSSG